MEPAAPSVYAEAYACRLMSSRDGAVPVSPPTLKSVKIMDSRCTHFRNRALVPLQRVAVRTIRRSPTSNDGFRPSCGDTTSSSTSGHARLPFSATNFRALPTRDVASHRSTRCATNNPSSNELLASRIRAVQFPCMRPPDRVKGGKLVEPFTSVLMPPHW